MMFFLFCSYIMIANCRFLMYCDQTFDVLSVNRNAMFLSNLLSFFHSFVPSLFLSVRTSVSQSVVFYGKS